MAINYYRHWILIQFNWHYQSVLSIYYIPPDAFGDHQIISMGFERHKQEEDKTGVVRIRQKINKPVQGESGNKNRAPTDSIQIQIQIHSVQPVLWTKTRHVLYGSISGKQHFQWRVGENLKKKQVKRSNQSIDYCSNNETRGPGIQTCQQERTNDTI